MTATAHQRGRRTSAASVAGLLFPPGSGEGGNNSLSPGLVSPGGGVHCRRRNSYAAGVIPELYIQSPTEMSPTLAQHMAATGSPQYTSQHFLDPNSAAAHLHRRRLPPTPLDLANGRLSGSNEFLPSPVPASGHPAHSAEGIIRRSSSPRVLPTPPPQQQQALLPSTSPPGNVGSQPFERRPSSRRRQLPPEPVQPQQSLDNLLGPKPPPPLPPAVSVAANSEFGTSVPPPSVSRLAVNGTTSVLQRSSSTRSARVQNRSAQLPPAPRQQQSLETESSTSSAANAPLPATSPRLARASSTSTTPAGLSGRQQKQQQKAVGLTISTDNTTRGADLEANGNANANPPNGGAIVNCKSALTPTPPQRQQPIVSAPSTPREQLSSTSASPMRKYSSDSPSVMNDLAAICSLNLQRNGSGSMAHLLEQQHILRREFTATPASSEGGGPTTAGVAAQLSQSNSSSLSPSMEQLNCTVASRSGSDAEIVADPSVLGFDPSLYNGSSGASGSAHSLVPSDPGTSSFANAPEARPRGLGLIQCTLQHFPVRKRLRVNVLKIEGLAGELRPDLEIQPFCKLILLPGKKQQQQSVVKRGRDVVFNQEFFFDGVATEEIELKQLTIEVCHSSGQKLLKDLEIGEVRIPLRDLTQQLQTKKEVRIVEELKLTQGAKKLGRLQISTCIEKEARRLTINLLKAEDLPKWGIVGAPDVQIRIKMQQSSGPEVQKSSRVLKNTTSAVYKEAVMFLISTKEADLLRTKITISVHDLSRSVTGQDVIGSVFLGELAVDKSEQDQWRNTMDHWGKEYKAVHALKGPGQSAPDVHVSDVQEEDANGD